MDYRSAKRVVLIISIMILLLSALWAYFTVPELLNLFGLITVSAIIILLVGKIGGFI